VGVDGPFIPLIGDWTLGWLLIASGATFLVVMTLLYYWDEEGTLGEWLTVAGGCGAVILAGVFIEDWVAAQTLVGVSAIVLLILWLRTDRRRRVS
jgi:hypothetical protein